MSLLLAPYNNAMRLGMGYTQSLCINGAVQKPNGIKASESDLKAVEPARASEPGSQRGPEGYGRSSGSEVRVLKDGQTTVSQTVTWEAKFIDKISEVTESLNISGSLAIKVDAIGGGGAAEGHYIDSNKFKESDINYLISVKVTNQQLVADDVTQFSPIRNVQPADFTNVYGDSYISGFLEGGIFNAVVSVKLKDKSSVKDFGGSLAVKLGFSGVSVEGTAKGGKKAEDNSVNSETTITVSWSGGGDIKPDDIVDWDIASLKRVAMEFPDRVASCPQRTSAVITKYTGLRSFYEQNLKGSPLDYENAGVYASALLDAYMDYKSIWKQLATTIWEVDNSLSKLTARDSSDELQEYAKGAKDDYEEKMKKHNAKTPSNQVARQSDHSNEVPMAPNAVVPYTASVFGLDKAKRDCRFEMIKIVREVDAVTVDPAVAIDANRTWQYLSPVVFRRLLPKVSNVHVQEEKESLEETKKTLEASLKDREKLQGLKEDAEKKYNEAIQANKTLEGDLERLKGDVASAGKRYEEAQASSKSASEVAEKRYEDAMKKASQDAETTKKQNEENLQLARRREIVKPQSGKFFALDYGWQQAVNSYKDVVIKFPQKFDQPPRMIHGLNHIDLAQGRRQAVSAMTTRPPTNESFGISVYTFGGCHGWNIGVSWMTLPDDIHIEYGMWDTLCIGQNLSDDRRRVNFSTAFSSPPKVLVWMQEINANVEWFSLTVKPEGIDSQGFDIYAQAWAGRRYDGVRVGWLAYPSEEDGKRCRYGRQRVERATKMSTNDHPFYSGSFSRDPATFIAISEIDFGCDYTIRARADINSVTKDRLNWSFGTWGDSNMDHIEIT